MNKACLLGHIFPFILAAVILMLCQPSLRAQTPDPEAVLQAFRDSFNWTRNLALQMNATEKSDARPDQAYMQEISFYKEGGERMREVVKAYSSDSSPKDPESGMRIQRVYSRDYDGFSLNERLWGLEGARVPETLENTLEIYEDGKRRFEQDLVTHMSGAGVLLGYPYLLSQTPIHELLTVENTSIATEEHEGIRYSRVTASLPQGEVELWLLPEKGYVMKRCVLTKEHGKHLDIHGEAWTDGGINRHLKQSIYELSIAEYQERDGYYIPLRLDIKNAREFEDEKLPLVHSSINISEIDLNPDFEAIRAFDCKFSDDSEVYFRKKDGSVFTQFKWEDGKLLALMDEQTLDTKIRETLTAIEASPSERKAPAKLSLLVNKLDPDAAAQMKEELWLYMLTAAGVIVLIIGWVVCRMVRRRRESK